MRKVRANELSAFVTYCGMFYGPNGIYSMGVPRGVLRTACKLVSCRNDIPFDGDTIDRETVAAILHQLGYGEEEEVKTLADIPGPTDQERQEAVEAFNAEYREIVADV